MPALNLVSAAMPTDDKVAILAAIQTIKEKMPFLISLSDGNRSVIRTAASKRAGYIQDVKDAVKAFPEVLPQSFDREEFLRYNALSAEISEVTSTEQPSLVSGLLPAAICIVQENLAAGYAF